MAPCASRHERRGEARSAGGGCAGGRHHEARHYGGGPAAGRRHHAHWLCKPRTGATACRSHCGHHAGLTELQMSLRARCVLASPIGLKPEQCRRLYQVGCHDKLCVCLQACFSIPHAESAFVLAICGPSASSFVIEHVSRFVWASCRCGSTYSTRWRAWDWPLLAQLQLNRQRRKKLRRF